MFRTTHRGLSAAAQRLRFPLTPQHRCPFPTSSLVARLSYSSSSSDTDLLHRVFHLRERAQDMERRSAAALERLGELSPPRTPIAKALKQVEPVSEGVEWAEQPSASITDVQKSVDDIAQRLKELGQRLLQLRKKQLRRVGVHDEVLQHLMEEANQFRSEVSRLRHTNEEVRDDDRDRDDVRVGPIPPQVAEGSPEPVWLAIPLKGEDIEELPSSAAEEGAADVLSPVGRMEGRDTAGLIGAQQQRQPHSQPHVASHVRKELPEDQAVGTPTEERGTRNVPLRGFTRRPGARP